MKKMRNKELLLEQVAKKLQKFTTVRGVEVPQRGWIHASRTALGMSMRQLGRRMKKTAQSVNDFERAEASGAITLRSLREAGKAMGLKLVYGYVPEHESLESMIEKRAQEIAKTIVLRTSHSMKLEDQENEQARIEKAIQERAEDIKREIPRYLWD